jgi:hypothetical protein
MPGRIAKTVLLCVLAGSIVPVCFSQPGPWFGNMSPNTADQIFTFPDGWGQGLHASDVTVQNALDDLNMLVSNDVPDGPTSACDPSRMAYESGFLYVCVANATWERVALATWVVGSLLQENGDFILQEDGSSKINIE